MTSLLMPSAVTLLAHKRLVDAVEGLQRKVVADVFHVGFFAGAEQVVVNPPERQVLGLARAARAMFEAGPPVVSPASLQVGQGLGQYAILGAAGFELPGYADVFAPGGGWVTNAIRRGTPDPNLSRVVVGTTQLAVRAGELGLAETAVVAERQRVQGFSMGLLSAVAYGVVASPVLRGLQAKRTKREWSRHSPAGDLTAAEQRVLRELLGGPGAAARWQGFWPATSDVPDALFTGLAKALEEVYGLAANRPRGFADFEDGFEAGDPMTALRLRNGYSILRQDAASSAWSWGGWYLVLTPLLVMPSIGLLIARELPNAGAFFDSRGVDEASFFELLTLGMGLGALPAFGYSMFLWSQIPEHTGTFVNALLLFFARAVLVPAGLASYDADPLVRWLALFLPLVGTDIYSAIRAAVAKARGRPGDAFVFFLNTLPALTALQLLLFAGLMELVGVDSDLAFWLLWALFTLLMLLALGLPLSWALSRSGGYASFFMRDRLDGFPLLGELADAGAPDDVAALALLFDESGLWHDPGLAAAPTLADLRYPSGPRALVRIWWTGSGDLQIAHDDHKISLKRGTDAPVDVLLPPGKLTAADIATRVQAVQAVLDGVSVEVVGPDDPAYDLPFSHTLSDPGDTLATLAEHEAHKADFVPVGKSKDKAFLLRHSPRVELVTGYGSPGSTRSQLDAIGLVPSGSLADLELSALGAAADLAVLLALGAAPSLAGAPVAAEPFAPAPLPAPLSPVYQVFRQWNLDERRVNEWRMLVSGGAESEKLDPALRDPAMRPDPANAAYASNVPGGEPLTNQMGWLPLWRAWLRMASDVTTDTAATTAMPYTPVVATRDGRKFQPTNAQLTDGVRFLLDLP